MPTYIVLRLTPPTAIDENAFTTDYLNNLTIKVYDVSYADSSTGDFIGSAAFVPGWPAPSGAPPGGTRIAQHDNLPSTTPELYSVATAVIQYDPPVPPAGPLGPEYLNPDIRVEFDRGAAQPVFDSRLYYNVALLTDPGPFPDPNNFKLIPDSEVGAFVTLPPLTKPFTLLGDGTPPNFDDLMAAVSAVLASDPGVAVDLANLSVEQCKHIANEIVYGSQAPLPTPPEALENMYTDPPNSGSSGDSHEQNRQQFQGQLTGYYGPADAAVIRLTSFVYSLSAAVWCETQTKGATDALVTFPVNPNAAAQPVTTMSEAQVIFTGALGLDVPAAYFYALTYDLSTHITSNSRYRMALGSDQQANFDRMTRVVNSGWIDLPAAMNPAQAARILEALNVPTSTTVPEWPVTNASANQIFKTDWVQYPPVAAWANYKPGDDAVLFWKPEAVAQAAAFLDLVLLALAQGYMIGANSLADEIKARLLGVPLAAVSDITKASPDDWQRLFAALPGILMVPPDAVLPTFTLPGSVPARIAAFISYVQKFFQMGTANPLLNAVAATNPLQFGVPSNDIIAQTIANYAGFALGMAINSATLEAAAAAALPGDEEAQTWAVQTVQALNELFILSQVATPDFNFSVMEALFARGFSSREDVLEHPIENFQQALTGTIAYDSAATIYANAGVAPVNPLPGGTSFGPINPGCLTDCIPPPHFSPLGPVAYLHEMLQVSERSSCDAPLAPPAAGHTTLQKMIDDRRGPVENLAVTRANLETTLPMIDLVNECLEFMASTTPATKHGVVYDTSEDVLSGHTLCGDECDDGREYRDCGCESDDCEHYRKSKHAQSDDCHKAGPIFDALPEYSTPATPVAKNNTVEPAVWNKLKADFSACCLPYDQALDVNRSYLEHFRSCRFEEMRTFRKDITEFTLDPVNQPADFQSHLWRYPVRLDIAIEYLGISPDEYATLFSSLAGAAGELPSSIRVEEFLDKTCLTYCEFLDLWKSGFVEFLNGADGKDSYPDCEPCCLDNLSLEFEQEGSRNGLLKLLIFVRLWRKLQNHCGASYTFVQLADICNVLDLSSPDFVRQMAAFQMFRDQFRLRLTDAKKVEANATGADRTFLLSLWVGPASKHWDWALLQFLEGVAYHAKCHHRCEPRAPEFIKLLETNLDPLSRLAGFDPTTPANTWQAVPTHTLRLAEVLAKIYASSFSIGEVLFLFTADTHLVGEDPFPLQDQNEASDLPLGLPDDEHEHSLWKLRRKLLDIHVDKEELAEWTWRRIQTVLVHEFGFALSEVGRLGEHFFPHVLEDSGIPVSQVARRFTGNLGVTHPEMWNALPKGPFRYDTASQQLWAMLPISDRDVLGQLTHLQGLDAAEQQAVQDVYFQARLILTTFAMLFDNFGEAELRLIEEGSGEERWRYFQRQVCTCHARCHTLAAHLSEHVKAVAHQEHTTDNETAHLILKNLFADANAATAPWESDNGNVPPVTWSPPANGGAFAALLGLTGTGVDGEFTVGSNLVWREIRESMKPFGHERDRESCPVPTVIPSMGLVLTPSQMQYVTVRNGLAMDDAKGEWLGGAQGFEAKWHGVLLINKGGEYTFQAGAPEGHEVPNPHGARHRSWRIVLKRGQRTWILLRHRWYDEENLEPACIRLERGAYDFAIDFVQHSPEYLIENEIYRQHTGFEVKYRGPDTEEDLTTIPYECLYRIRNDSPMSVANLKGSPSDFLRNRYASSLRDIRRTYQRAFKALLFTHRFKLSAKPHAGQGSELGYLLSQADKFAGSSCYRNGGAFVTHKAGFNFNFLPVGDPFFSPLVDDRASPSRQRMQALFDWWERIFDYGRVRQEVREHCDRHLWLLFEEAHDEQPADPTGLLRHMGADARHWPLDMRFFQGQNTPVYAVKTSDLEDDRWMVRSWHADLWLRHVWSNFTVRAFAKARPDLWASDNPAGLVTGEAETGNANLLQFVSDGCFENGAPRRYEDMQRLNDGLRERGRNALIGYLCGNGVAKSANELSEILLLDVLAGRCEKASRIEEAVSSIQTFIRRARMGLEPAWVVTSAFAHLWDCRYANYRVWQACRRRELYKENWIDWHEVDRARKIEAFQFLDEQLKRATLTVAASGGVDYWPDHLPPSHPDLCLLQQREQAEMQILPAAREGLNLLAMPEREARPSWISAAPDPPAQGLADSSQTLLAVVPSPAAAPAARLPLWMECAIRLGTRFVRVAAARYPPASARFEPRHVCDRDNSADAALGSDKECCVTCCEECGCDHPAHIDEYYFWLVDAEYFRPEAQSVYSNIFDGQQSEYYDQNAQVATPWHDESKLSDLLEWPSEPLVRLAWCRVHNGEFQQPRRSDWGLAYKAGTGVPDLEFRGRVDDSLYLEITNPANAGFRYDMVPDAAKELDNLAVPAGPSLPPPPAGLIAYPYFAYFQPGARLFPWTMYSPSIAMAHTLRAHCRFEAALKWYELVYRPLERDNRWALCDKPDASTRREDDAPGANIRAVNQDEGGAPAPNDKGCCCDTTAVTCRDARHRSILLHYLDSQLEWGDALMRRNAPEAFQQARLVFDTMFRIMGRHPRVVKNAAKPSQTVSNFSPLPGTINPRLMTLYDQLDDRLSLIRECMSPRRLVGTHRTSDEGYWTLEHAWHGWRTILSACCDTDGSCQPCSPYRFTFRIQRAKELAAQTRELGSAFLAALEKGDGEFLASVRARHEREIAHLTQKIREDLWRDADWAIQALQKSKQGLQASRRYYAQLIANGLNGHENTYVDMTNVSMDDRAASNIFEGIAEAMDMIPDIFVGSVDFTQIPVGTKLAGLFKTIARITNTVADIANTTGSLDLTEAGWDRRLQDWVHQVEVLDIQIEQTELQILGAERRRDQSVREVNIQQRTIEQATETLDLLRDKFTNHAVYLFLQKQTADLYRLVWGLSLDEAHRAENAFNFERGHTARKFIGCDLWDNLHDGLLAGERLQLDLGRMEKEYLDRNCREYELTKHISMRLSFPLEFVRLKLTGKCEIEIPEWMFDLDYPGHYMRRIKNVSLTIPCVSGPFNEVHCRLTLLRAGTRIDPLAKVPAASCCHCCQRDNGYLVCPHDPRWVSENGSLEAIATSSGENDAGLFEVNFHDERYLPFEYHGAVSRWRIEMPPENNFFDMESLSDLVLHLNYTAREGGEKLRRAATAAVECNLPGAGWCLFDLRHDFADAWNTFQQRGHEEDERRRRHLDLCFRRSMFPYVPGNRDLFIDKFALLFDRPTRCGCECPSECPCCRDSARAHHEFELRYRDQDEDRFRCVASEHWPGLYHGVVDELRLGPLRGRHEQEHIRVIFPHTADEIHGAFVLCRYHLKERCCTSGVDLRKVEERKLA